MRCFSHRAPPSAAIAARVVRRNLHLNHRTIAIDDAQAHKQPLVILHGLFGSLSNFGSPARQLAAARPVVLADLRNHGASPWSDDCSLEAMASDLIELLDDAGAQEATVCGHSLGGKVAMVAALMAPERISRLVVVDIAPVEYKATDASWRANLEIMDALAAMPAEALTSRAAADVALASSVSEAGIRGFLLQNLVPGESGSWRLNLHTLRQAAHEGVYAGFPEDLPPAPESLPVRVIAGSRSTYFSTSEHRDALEHFFPGAEPDTCVVEAGHWLHAEKPKDFVRLVDEFCAQGD